MNAFDVAAWVTIAWCCAAVAAAAAWVWRNRRRCRDCEEHEDIIHQLIVEAAAEQDPNLRAQLIDGVERAEAWRLIHWDREHAQPDRDA